MSSRSGQEANAWREAERGTRPTAPRAPDSLRRCEELSEFPARLLPALPAPTTLFCEACILGGASVRVVVTTSARDHAAARARGLVVLHGGEWAAVVLAVELGRLAPMDFEHWVARKQEDPSWTLIPKLTLGAWVSPADQRELTVGEVLRACRAELVDVSVAAVAADGFWERP